MRLGASAKPLRNPLRETKRLPYKGHRHGLGAKEAAGEDPALQGVIECIRQTLEKPLAGDETSPLQGHRHGLSANGTAREAPTLQVHM